MIAPHFPVLAVVVPLLAAPLVVIFAHAGLAWLLALLASIVAFAMSVDMLYTVSDGTVLIYALGDWAPPWGIEYRVDRLNALVAVLVSGASVLVLPFARHSVPMEVAQDRLYLFYACWLLCLTGLLGIVITGDAFNVFVFLEISSLSTYVLVSLSQRRQAQVAAFRYLIMGTVGATFILIGIGLLYMMTGTLNMADLADRLADGSGTTRPVVAAMGFILVGIAVKMALFPVHTWLPSAYYQAPMAVTAFLAGTATKVSLYLLVRFALSVFGADYAYNVLDIGLPLVVMGCLAAIVGSMSALHASDVKRLLAYSSLAQIGYMVIGISLGTVTGVAAGMLHVFNHALMKVALFIAVGCVLWQYGSVKLATFDGLGRRMPVTMAAFTVAAASLVGVPLTAGFVSKWYVVVAVLEHGWWPVAVVVIATSLMAVFYLGKILERVWLAEPNDIAPRATSIPPSMVAAAVLLALANLWFGIDTTWSVDIALGAARDLLGVAAP